MELDFNQMSRDAVETDICVIGGGAAGIALAYAMRNGSREVLLVEGGDVDPTPQSSVLLGGESEGLPFRGLTEGRARGFGGTTRLWFGQCIRLDPIDFERKAWVPESGWPITCRDLEPFYDRSEKFLNLSNPSYDASIWSKFGIVDPKLDPEIIVPKFTIYCRQPDFKIAYRDTLRRSKSVRVMLNATVARLNSVSSGKAIYSAEIRNMNGRSGRIEARYFVLCGGGVENARLLLASNDIMTCGIGNTTDLVGRYFQEHPTGRTAEIHPRCIREFQAQFGILHSKKQRYWPKLALSAANQRERQVLNANAYPVYDYPEHGGVNDVKDVLTALKDRRFDLNLGRSIWRSRKAAKSAVREALRFRLFGRAPIFQPSRCWLQVHIEQAPDPANRVMLSETRDPLGVPKAKIVWNLSKLEVNTLVAMVEAVAREFRQKGLAEVDTKSWHDALNSKPSFGLNDAFHHAGTTRMAESPSRGVVDSDCRVHGMANLFVVGGSVFPTSGYANPTLTIIALAIRLADHLSARGAGHKNLGTGGF